MSFVLKIVDEPIPDVIPLTASEKRRKQELEGIVQSGLEEFLCVGLALAELRNRRLYRVEFGTFEEYARARFNMARSSLDQLIRSASTAQCLLEAGVQLPKGTTEAVIRPISALPGDELQAGCWQLAESFSGARGPTVRLVARLCSVVRDCLENPLPDTSPEPDAKSPLPQSSSQELPKKSHETPFNRPVARLASWSGFSASIIVAGVDKLENAANLYRSCGILAERCRQVQTTLAANYPELASHA